jgi:hypothetical protein
VVRKVLRVRAVQTELQVQAQPMVLQEQAD